MLTAKMSITKASPNTSSTVSSSMSTRAKLTSTTTTKSTSNARLAWPNNFDLVYHLPSIIQGETEAQREENSKEYSLSSYSFCKLYQDCHRSVRDHTNAGSSNDVRPPILRPESTNRRQQEALLIIYQSTNLPQKKKKKIRKAW